MKPSSSISRLTDTESLKLSPMLQEVTWFYVTRLDYQFVPNLLFGAESDAALRRRH